MALLSIIKDGNIQHPTACSTISPFGSSKWIYNRWLALSTTVRVCAQHTSILLGMSSVPGCIGSLSSRNLLITGKADDIIPFKTNLQ